MSHGYLEAMSLQPLPLPEDISQQWISCHPSCLTFHYLSAGTSKKPLILLLHGFPDLAYSWRHILLPLAQQTGCYVVAPDQRGYGRTLGWHHRARTYQDTDTHIEDYAATNLARDIVYFIRALGYNRVQCLVGHDFGAVSASALALTRPDLVDKLVLMSHPFKSPPRVPFDVGSAGSSKDVSSLIERNSKNEATGVGLGSLTPPKKHYRDYNSTADAVSDWDNPPEGLTTFLRGYFHVKSALFAPNNLAEPLNDHTASELARMPFYYIMPKDFSMPQAVTQLLADENDHAERSRSWMSDEELAVYVTEWQRTGFVAGLSWYKARSVPNRVAADWALFDGPGLEKLQMPVKFISGAQDWGNFQEAGALKNMENGKSCANFGGKVLIDNAGHWVQMEQPKQVVQEIVQFMKN
jgi:pimeloyl-ACP methyl ester carboxylesterase